MAAFSTNILIVGAGPTGLTTALGLAQRGIEFRIIDALPEAQNALRSFTRRRWKACVVWGSSST